MNKYLYFISMSLEEIKEIKIVYILAIIFYLLFFLSIGSFLNVLIYRLPKGLSIIKNSSHCPNCGYKIKWYENIPIISYLLLRGKCSNCKEKIAIRYFIVEILSLLIAIISLIRFDLSYTSIIVTLLLEIFVVIFYIDKNEMIIPDVLNIIILILSIISLFFVNITSHNQEIIIDYKDKLISIVINIVIFVIFIIIEKIIQKSIIGGGDLKLFFGIGIFMGWQLELLGIVLACIIGVVFEILFFKTSKRKVLPFGPYLVCGFTISLFFGPDLILWYLGLF